MSWTDSIVSGFQGFFDNFSRMIGGGHAPLVPSPSAMGPEPVSVADACSPYHGRFFVCAEPETHVGKVVDNGQCVRLVQVACGAPHTSLWAVGPTVKGNSCVPVGTAIATFVDGVYPNLAAGNHAAIYMGQDGNGIQVIDQWSGRPTGPRTIRFKGGSSGSASNDGDCFSVIVSRRIINGT